MSPHYGWDAEMWSCCFCTVKESEHCTNIDGGAVGLLMERELAKLGWDGKYTGLDKKTLKPHRMCVRGCGWDLGALSDPPPNPRATCSACQKKVNYLGEKAHGDSWWL